MTMLTIVRTTIRAALAACAVGAAAAAMTVPASPARAGNPSGIVTATKSVSGAFEPGTNVTYTIVITNAANFTQLDNPGNELTDVLPASLTLVSASATSGTAVATLATNTVTWNGSIPSGGTVTITVTATVGASVAAGTAISNQATVNYDSDNNGTNNVSDTSDDPGTAAPKDPTTFVVPDTVAPTVTAAPAAGQASPTTDSPIVFDVVFSEPVTGFTDAGVVIGGTAGATSAAVTGSGTAYQVNVSGMTAAGTVTITVTAGAAVDGSQNPNTASDVSTPVQFDIVVPPTTTTTAPETTTTTTTTAAPVPTTPVPTSAPGDVTLPETGSSTAPIAIVALVVLLVGVGLVVLRRRPSRD